jgi:hypothetical protein
MTTKDTLALAREALEESIDDVRVCLCEAKHCAGYARYDRQIAAYEAQIVKHEAAITAIKQAQQAQKPRVQRSDWLPIANALDHAVKELGRTKEANAHDWNTAVYVFEFARRTSCTCCGNAINWPDAYRCLDCKNVLCETCAPIHFGPNHSSRAAEAHKGI